MSPYIKPDSTGTKTSLNISNGFEVKNVLAVPELENNLLSIGQACDDGVINKAVFDRNGCHLIKGDRIVASGSREDRLYVIRSQERDRTEHALTTMDIWHRRFGHGGRSMITSMIKTGSARF